MTEPRPPSALVWWGLFQYFLYLSLIAGSIVLGYMVYFLRRYREKGEAEGFKPHHAAFRVRLRETILFASISAVILLSLAVVSTRDSVAIMNPPTAGDTLTIDVTAFQWAFKFSYPNNVTTIGECRIPSGIPVIFNVTSIDVMHNFGLPAFRLRIDAIPGRYNTIWVQIPTQDGINGTQYQIRCYELCGTGHTYMTGNLTVMDPDSFAAWYANSTQPTYGPPNVTIDLYAGEILSTQYGFGNMSSMLTSPGPTFNVHLNDTVLVMFHNVGQLPHAFGVVDSLGSGYNILFGSAIASGISPIPSQGSANVTFVASQAGTFYYICTVPGHVALGMWGQFIVS